MIKPIRSILFATDLTTDCQAALDFTMAQATRFHATVYLLHVIEKLPDHMNERLKDLLGTHEWDKMVNSHQEDAHKSMLGKTSTNTVIRQAIHDFCKEVGIDDKTCDFQSREIIISDGDIVEDIIENAEKNECDLIVLGGHKTIFSKTSIGSTIKGVLKNSTIPVTVVPSSKA